MRTIPALLSTLVVSTSFLACGSSGNSVATSGTHASSSSSGTGGAASSSTSTGGTSTGGAGGSKSDDAPPAWNRMVTPPSDADATTKRTACGYQAGALPAETQGSSYPMGANIPIKHILILMQENRSFDHYFMKLPENGQTDVEVAPATYTNPDTMGNPTAPFHDTRYCFVDTNHEWAGSHQEYDSGKMDGFILANENSGTAPPHPLPDSMSGVRAMAYYDATDIPFYYWLANEFSIADHYHAALLGPTWPNRMYLYAATSRGLTTNTFGSFTDQAGSCMSDADCGNVTGACVNQVACKGTCKVDSDCGLDAPVGTCDVAGGGVCNPIGRTIFDYMEARKLNWKIYAAGTPGYAMMVDQYVKYRSAHQVSIDQYFADAKAGTLPDVAFIDPHLGNEVYNGDDEHPPASPQPGQLFVAKAVQALTQSPEWSSSALFITYDEHGGLFDHVVPPSACEPDTIQPMLSSTDPPGAFNQYGVRVPMIVVSPYAKKHYVGHSVYDHTSLIRFIEARFTMGALTARDANALAPWEMFDFNSPPHAQPPSVTLPTVNQTILDACAMVWNP